MVNALDVAPDTAARSFRFFSHSFLSFSLSSFYFCIHREHAMRECMKIVANERPDENGEINKIYCRLDDGGVCVCVCRMQCGARGDMSRHAQHTHKHILYFLSSNFADAFAWTNLNHDWKSRNNYNSHEKKELCMRQRSGVDIYFIFSSLSAFPIAATTAAPVNVQLIVTNYYFTIIHFSEQPRHFCSRVQELARCFSLCEWFSWVCVVSRTALNA